MDTTKNTWISVIARIGFIAKGFVYFIVGLIAMQVAMGIKGTATGTQEALRKTFTQPLGYILLIGCMLGLLAHAVWKLLQSLLDPEDRKDNLQTGIFRVIDFVTGCLYFSLSYAAWQILRGIHTQSSSQSTEVWVSKILGLPYGKWIIFFSAAIIVLASIYQFYSAYKANFTYRFDLISMNQKEKGVLRQLGRIGFSVWGIIYVLIGFLFYKAAIHYDASEAGGLADALNTLQKNPYGIWLLGIISGGLIIYGIYLLVFSYYHKI